jgi:hypothetical protein
VQKSHWVHLTEKRDHDITCLIIIPDSEEKKNISENIGNVLKLLSEIRLKVLNTTKKVIESITKSEISALKVIQEYKKFLKKFYMYVESNNDVFKEDYELFCKIQNIDIDTLSLDVGNALTKVRRFYNISFARNQDDKAFLVYLNRLQTINLKNFKSKIKELDPIDNSINSLCIDRNFQCAKIGENQYFYLGSKHAYIVNMKSYTYKKVREIYPQYGALIYKNNRVYAFGQQKGSLCKYYDINQNEWEDLTLAPICGINSTACLFQDNILILGDNYQGLYSYDEKMNRFQIICNDIQGKYKYVMHGWIVSDKRLLYKIQKKNEYYCQCFPIDLHVWDYKIMLHCSFIREKFIYFVTQDSILYRINTEENALEKVFIIFI